MYMYMYMYTCVCIYVYVYIYMYIYVWYRWIVFATKASRKCVRKYAKNCTSVKIAAKFLYDLLRRSLSLSLSHALTHAPKHARTHTIPIQTGGWGETPTRRACRGSCCLDSLRQSLTKTVQEGAGVRERTGRSRLPASREVGSTSREAWAGVFLGHGGFVCVYIITMIYCFGRFGELARP